MTKWEYKLVHGRVGIDVINNLGENGWEMCGSISDSMGHGSLWFKRIKA